MQSYFQEIMKHNEFKKSSQVQGVHFQEVQVDGNNSKQKFGNNKVMFKYIMIWNYITNIEI